MRYYLDFDRTVFDTDSFGAYMEGRGTPVSELEARAQARTLSFEPGELSRFLFPDAAQFLRDKENAVTIITFENPALQELKVKSALQGIPRMSVMYTGKVRKGKYLGPHAHLHADAIAVDDSPEELASLAAHCAPMALYEMRRDGTDGDGRWPVIRSLAELP